MCNPNMVRALKWKYVSFMACQWTKIKPVGDPQKIFRQIEQISELFIHWNQSVLKFNPKARAFQSQIKNYPPSCMAVAKLDDYRFDSKKF